MSLYRFLCLFQIINTDLQKFVCRRGLAWLTTTPLSLLMHILPALMHWDHHCWGRSWLHFLGLVSWLKNVKLGDNEEQPCPFLWWSWHLPSSKQMQQWPSSFCTGHQTALGWERLLAIYQTLFDLGSWVRDESAILHYPSPGPAWLPKAVFYLTKQLQAYQNPVVKEENHLLKDDRYNA